MKKNFGCKPWLVPEPVLIIGTYDENGNPDAMNAAWGGVYEGNQVILCLSEGHKTTKNIKTRKAFTLAFATADQAVASDYVGIVSANDVPDKLAKAGWTTIRSEFVDAPVIEQLPMCMECTLDKIGEDGHIIGTIVNVAADESILDEAGKIDLEKMAPISFDPTQNVYRVLGKAVARAFYDGNQLNK